MNDDSAVAGIVGIRRRTRRRRWPLAVLVTGILGVVSLLIADRVWGPWRSAARLHSLAQAALERGEYGRAEALASRIRPEGERWPRAQLIAGEAAMREGRYEDAAGYFAAVPRDGTRESVLAVFSLAEVQRQRGRLSEAVECYRYVLEHDPDGTKVHAGLAFVLALTSQQWKARPHFMHLVRNQAWTLDTLVLLGDLERPMEEKDYLKRCMQNAPDDVLVQLAAGRLAMAEERTAEARRRLKEVVERAPEIMSAQALLGELLIDGEPGDFLEWHARLPPEADEHSDIWFVRGRWARRQGKPEVAARCFWETVRRMPLHRRGHYELGLVLNQLGHPQQAEPFLQRARRQLALTQALDEALRSRGRRAEVFRRIAGLMNRLDRPWEAWAWAATAAHKFPQARWPREFVSRLQPKLGEETPQMLKSARLALRHDFSGYPDHSRLFASRPAQSGRPRADDFSAGLRFEDLAGRAGLDFVYYNSPDPSTQGVRMFEANGGGVAVIDFDNDAWPDLYFTQGAPWTHGDPAATPSDQYINTMYRNVGGTFVDVTRETGLGDQGFGQGLAVGDFNSDGFPDLYVANVGRNRLFRNNGDGTFADVTEEAGLPFEDWTASCVVVDLNGDGLPDLYDVTYLEGERLYEIICDGLACSPRRYEGALNRFYINRGDGTFEYSPHAINAAPKEDSKGMGVVAVDCYGTGRLSLLIANDQTPNFFLRNTPSKSPAGLRLENEAFSTGLAFDANGLPLACMGIAADDADGDGRIDFYVTNFKGESNTLYLQDLQGLFVDSTKPAGLDAPSQPFVGWGTEFLDADLDGWPDLVVVNGDVDDYRDRGGRYHMRPQFYSNAGEGRFVERSADELGDYFDRKYLGRGLARLDWNRDGRMDFAVSNIGDRVSLVTNRSKATGHFLNVRLHATGTARDAIGSVVEVETPNGRWRKQLTAGDGYMASNERMLQFGLGDADSVGALRVNWLSGETTTLRDLPVDVTVELVEGGARATLWRDSELESLALR